MEPTITHLSEDLAIEILSRVPVKFLIRFTVVCKSWRSIITSSKFSSLHLSKLSCDSNKILLSNKYVDEELPPSRHGYPFEERYTVFNEDAISDSSSSSSSLFLPLDFPFKYPKFASHRILGTINGLICISGRAKYPSAYQCYLPIILWNPTVRKHVVLPDPPRREADSTAIEYGYCAKTNDYKVVLVTRNDGQDELLVVDIYSLNSNTWRRLDVGSDMHGGKSFVTTGAFFKGKIHWKVWAEEQHGFYWSIYSFDVEEEVEVFNCKKLKVPNDLSSPEEVTIIKDCLTVVDRCSIWVMEEYGNINSWKKLCQLDPRADATMLYYLKNGEFLLDSGSYTGDKLCTLMTYNPETRRSKVLEIHHDRHYFVQGMFSNHKESLVLFNHKKRKVRSVEKSSTRKVRMRPGNWSGQVQIKGQLQGSN